MPVHVGEIHTDVTGTGPSTPPQPESGGAASPRGSADAVRPPGAAEQRLLDGLRRAQWLAARVRSGGFDD